MAHTRDKTKRLVGFYASQGEKARLQAIADEKCITLSELLRRIADGDLVVVERPSASQLRDDLLNGNGHSPASSVGRRRR
jgi:hypothetical protein